MNETASSRRNGVAKAMMTEATLMSSASHEFETLASVGSFDNMIGSLSLSQNGYRLFSSHTDVHLPTS